MNQASGMLFSVVVPTRHRDELLRECLLRLAPDRQEIGSGRYEIIVTDDGDTSATRAFIEKEFPAVKCLPGPRKGPAANRNNGARAAQGDWILFCDDDCLPSASLLSAYRRAIEEHPGACVLEGAIAADGPRTHPLEDAPINEKGGLLWSCNLAFRADFFRELGGFCEEFPYAAMEDMDLRKRIRAAGVEVPFVPAAKVVHPWRMIDLIPHVRRHVASQRIYARRHPEEQVLFGLPVHLKNIARYYVRDFPRELREFGFLTLKCQPLKWWEMAYRGWHAAFRRTDRDALP